MRWRPSAQQRLGAHGEGTILFLDEIHRFTKSQQDALLPSVETGLLVLVGATTENPYFEVNPPLLSRSTLFRLRAARTRRAGRAGRAGPAGRGRRGRPGGRRPPGGPLRWRRSAPAHQPGGGTGVGRGPGRGGTARPHGAGRRGGRAGRVTGAVRTRRPLRRGVRLHQVHPGLGPGRRAALAGPDAGGGGGRPVHRPPTGDLGLRGRGHGRSPGRRGGGRRGPGRGVRGPARGPDQPGPGHRAPGPGPQVQHGLRRPGPGAGRRAVPSGG